MRILLLTPGTGGFYCGTCMRDNALALALRRQGHDAMMVPMYLPPSLDELSAAEGAPLFYGGINTYLQQYALFRKTPRWIDQLFDAPAALAGAARRAGMTKASELGALTLSMLLGEEGNQVKELERLVSWLRQEKPDAVILSNALLMGLGRRIKAETGAALFCTLQGEDAFLDSLGSPYAEKSWAAVGERGRDFDGFIAVSQYHADLMAERAHLDRAKIRVVYNGISTDGYLRPRPALPAVPTLGYLARMYAPKGLGTLVEAFVLVGKQHPTVRLDVAGAQTAGDLAYVAELQKQLAAAGLADRATFRPNVSRDEKLAFLQGLTLLSVPATYSESFGLYVIEALAAGVPVVQPNHAVFPELLAATGGGVLYDPLTPKALADRLLTLLADPAQIERLGKAGQDAVFDRFTVDAMAQGVLAAIGE